MNVKKQGRRSVHVTVDPREHVLIFIDAPTGRVVVRIECDAVNACRVNLTPPTWSEARAGHLALVYAGREMARETPPRIDQPAKPREVAKRKRAPVKKRGRGPDNGGGAS